MYMKIQDVADDRLPVLATFRDPAIVIRQWNWKAAALSAASRAPIFLVASYSYGWDRALLAFTVEIAYRATTAGFFAAFTQAIRYRRPTWLAALLITIGVPAVSLSLDYRIHRLMHTPNLGASILVSIMMSVTASLFTWYSMRHGTLLVGEEQDKFLNDLRRLPRLVLGFAAMPFIWTRRITGRFLRTDY
jgi:hypothetical protein